jgi:type I restriction enzyme S subunit
MNSEWKKTKLENLLTFANGKSSPDRSDSFLYLVYGSNGTIGYANQTNADAGTIVIGRVGSYCGSVYISKQPCWVTDNAIRATAFNNNDQRFLFYLLSTLNLNGWRAGSGQPLLNQEILNCIPVSIPDLPQQQIIAHILGALDDKIELNRRMNETLEEMARAIFKSWFVDFDPVRAKMDGHWKRGQSLPVLPADLYDLFPNRFVDSKLGKIPEGWEVMLLSEAIEVNPTRTLRKGELAPYLDMANMPTYGHTPDNVNMRLYGSGMRFANGDTLVARITPCLENGKTAFVDFLSDEQVGWGSTEYIVLCPKYPLPPEFGYCLARSSEFREFAIQSMTGTSGRQRVPAEVLSHFLLIFPSKDIAIQFGKNVQPLFSRIRETTRESRVLAALRDELLPKLISGKLRVKDAERFLKEHVS